MTFWKKLIASAIFVVAIVGAIVGFWKTPGLARDARAKAMEAKSQVEQLAQVVKEGIIAQDGRDKTQDAVIEGQYKTQSLLVEWVKEAKDK